MIKNSENFTEVLEVNCESFIMNNTKYKVFSDGVQYLLILEKLLSDNPKTNKVLDEVQIILI